MFAKLDCFIATLWRTLRRFIKTADITTVEGHLYETSEIHENVTVEVLKCTKCGQTEIGWRRE